MDLKKKPEEYTKSSDMYMTLEECAKELGVTRERVRQIEAKALSKLKAYVEANNLKLDDYL